MDTLASKALRNSQRWLSSSSSSYISESYDIAVYELEMAGEVALKALLIHSGLEVPKRHDVSRILRSLAHDNDIVPLNKMNKFFEFLDTFDRVTKFRGDAGYSYESSQDLDTFKELYQLYNEKINQLVEFASDIINSK